MNSLAVRVVAFAGLTMLMTGLLAIPYLTITPDTAVAEAKAQ